MSVEDAWVTVRRGWEWRRPQGWRIIRRRRLDLDYVTVVSFVIRENGMFMAELASLADAQQWVRDYTSDQQKESDHDTGS